MSKLLRSAAKGIASLLLLLAVLTLAVSAVLAARHERTIDTWKPSHYSVKLTLSKQLDSIQTARAEISLVVLKRNVSLIDLDFGELTTDSVTINGRRARFTHSAGQLLVTLPRAVSKGTRLTIVVSYHGVPRNGLVLTHDKGGNPAAVGDNWPNRVHHWIPSLDHPAAKATVAFSITAPEENLVVANGRFMKVQNNFPGMRTWTFNEGVPIPPYCMIFAAGQFAHFKVESQISALEYYVPQVDGPFALKGFAAAAPSLKLFTETVGPYPYEKLALIVGATQFGGMENSSAIVFASTLFNPASNVALSPSFGVREGLVEIVAHEVAHQWFGDSVTEATWSDLWLSEGFATYFAGLLIKKHDGDVAFQRYMQKAAATYLVFARQRRIPLHDTETEDLFKLLNGNSYQKGAWVLHMLRSQLGDEAFFRGVRAYYTRHRDATANSEDLRMALEKASGVNLRSFFASWVYGAGHPSYELAWSWSAEKQLLRVSLKQTQTESIFPNQLPLEIVTAAGKQRVLIAPTARETIAEFPLAPAPTAIEVDPDDVVLKEVVVKGPAG